MIYIAIGILAAMTLVLAALFGWALSGKKSKDKTIDLLKQAHKEDGQELRKLTIELEEARAQIHKEDISDDRDVLNAQKEQVIQDLNKTNEELQTRRTILTETNAQITTASADLVAAKDTILKLQQEIEGLKQVGFALNDMNKKGEADLRNLQAELEKLLNIQHVIQANMENCIWDPHLNSKEQKLVELLRELSDLYPELRVDFANIEWKKIWMPQLQNLGAIIDMQRGIYRLILKEGLRDPIKIKDSEGVEKVLPVCYVGQATDIKDRWYQHVKKMIGVMPKGNEKVYDWRPEDFRWCIIEKGKDIDLNMSEKYWIQYYCAKEGLNKKL